MSRAATEETDVADRVFDRSAYDRATSSGLQQVPSTPALEVTDQVVRATPQASGELWLAGAGGVSAARPTAAAEGAAAAERVGVRSAVHAGAGARGGEGLAAQVWSTLRVPAALPTAVA